MKKLYLTIIILQISVFVNCQVSSYGLDDFQSLQEEFYANYSDTIQDTNYLKNIKQFKRWERFWGPRLTGFNSFDSITKKRMNTYSQLQMRESSNDYSNWVELGPNTNGLYGIGRIDAIAIDVSNSNVIFAGSPSGGLWKSINGGGTWVNLSDYIFTILGISSIAIDPGNSNIVFAATGDVDSETTYSNGIYRSTDSGNTWETINSGLIDSNTPHFTIGKIILHSTDNSTAYLATSLGVYKCTNRNNSSPQWSKVYPSTGNEYVRNIGFKPGNPNVLYAVGIDIVTSNNNGNTWARFATANNGLDFSGTPWPNALNGLYIQVMNMAIDPSGNYIYVNGIVRDGEPPYNWQSFVDYKLWRYDIINNVWTERTNQPSVITPGRNEMAVFPSNSEILFSGGVSLYKSTNGGNTWNPVSSGYRHSAYHEILFNPNDNNILFVGTDGGIYKIDLQNQSSTELNNGLGISTMYNMASSIIDPYQILAGSQDDGINYLKNGQWTHRMSSDGFECYMDDENIGIMYGTIYNPYLTYSNGLLYRSDNGADSPSFLTSINPMQDNAFHGAALVAHPERTYELYQARQNIWKIANARTGGSNDWVKISDFSSKFPSFYGVNYALEIAPSNGNYIYTTYVDVSSWMINYDRVKLLKTSTGGGLNNGDWIDITPNPYDGNFTYFISDIAVSDKNPNELWVCYSGYMDDLKVLHYTGNAWINYSEGLPNIPLNTIIYFEGSNDMLFVGTDLGVYYRDNTMNQWMPFNNNLPNVIVSCLEINKTNHELRAATYGRGLWETDIFCLELTEEISVTNNQTWDTPMYIGNTLTIDNNAELTISSEVIMNQYAKIIVKSGAKLIIDGGYLRSSCSDPWDGIEVWGNSAEHQFPDANGNYKQGYLELKNGAVIENAQYAVRLWNSDTWDQMGGIVKADGATFRNNRKAVEFMSYQNFDPLTHLPMPNQSYFTNCLFETNEEYDNIIPYPFEAFITAWKVEGVVFKGCSFKDVRDDFTFSSLNQSMGIYTIDAGFSLLPNGTVRNHFEGLSFGVYSSQLETNNTYKIDKADFINNQIGIRNSSNNNATCIRSNFKLGTKEQYPFYYFNIGLLNTASTGFTFEQNEFEKSVGYPANHVFNAGMWNYNTGSSTNVIYKNTYTSLEIGNVAAGDNRPINQVESGLYYKCNENNTNISYDFDITPGLGIAANQGNRDKAAGNTFSHNTSPAFSDFYNEATMPVNYYYYVNDYDQRPINYSSNFTPISTSSQNTCSEHFPEGSGLFLDGNEIASLRAQYSNYKDEYNNTKALYESLKDGGDTPGTIVDIETSWPDETWELRAQLLADSPHLSSAVLMEAASRPEVLPNAILFEICMANPEEMRDARFLEFLATKEDPMPQYMIEELIDGADAETYKGVLQNEMTEYHSLFADACKQIVRNILIDTTGINCDSLRVWLVKTGTLEAAYQIVDSYFAQNDYTNAALYLSDIPNNFTLSAKQTKEYNYFNGLKTTLILVHQQNRNVMQLDSLEVAELVVIADSSNSVAGLQAQSLLNFAYGYNYFNLPELTPPGEKSSKITDFGSTDDDNTKENFLKIHPNPASQWVALDYNLPYTADMGVLVINDALGKQIKQLETRNASGQLIWDTRNVPTGVYFVRLVIKGKTIEQQKVVISR